ncbi:MAG: TonB-dependent receptor, partial [Vicinamibacterales bacterium]
MRALRTAALLAVALAMTDLATAQQTTTGTISGRIVDAQDLPIPGVAVTVTGAQGARTASTDSDGRFNVPFLTPGDYSVRAELQGFKVVEQPNVNVSLGQRVTLDLEMVVGSLAETVQVTSTSPLVDRTTTTVGAVINSETLNSVPVGRRMTDALYLAPGVSSGGDVGRANPSVAGSSGLENQYIVDGTNITNTGYGAIGSYSIVFGSLGSGVTFDFVKEIQVKTAGYEAEYGQATGGVVNVVTKSGSNNFSGSLFGYFRPEALEGTWTPLDLPNLTQTAATRTGTEVSDAGFELGGPIIQNRLFFFAAVNPQWERETFIGLEGSPLRDMLGEVDRDRSAVSYSAKGTFEFGSGHRLDASFFGDPSKGELGPQRTAAFRRADTKGFSSIDYGGHNQILKYDGVMSPNWLLEASYARAQNKIEETPSVNEWSFTDRTVSPNLSSGGIGFFEANDGVNHQYQVKSTAILGSHELRAGLGFEQIDYLQGANRTGPTITAHDGTVTETGAQVQILDAPELPSGRMYRVVRANFQQFRETEQEYFNFFAQDTWTVGTRLTIKPGIRYEQQNLGGNLESFKWDGNWAPRIGVTLDPFGQGRSKIFGNWGRFFAKIPNDLAARALSADAGVTRGDYYDAGLTQPIPHNAGVFAGDTDQHYLTAGLSAADFDPDSRSTYLDEALVGFEHEVLPNLNLGVRYIKRTFGSVLEDVGTAPMISYFLGIPGLDSVE